MYQFESRVRYSEVDSHRRLTLPALFNYMQDCCSFQSEQFGVGVDYLTKIHAAWVIASWEVQLERKPTFGEKICVKTWPYAFRGFCGYRNFLLESAQGELLVRANSVWVFLDAKTMRPARIAEGICRAYENALCEPLSGNWSDRKIILPEGGEEKEPLRVAHAWIDTNGHMNNERYIEAALEYLPQDYGVSGLRVEYKHSAMLGDRLYPVVSEEQGSMTVVLANEKQRPYAVVQFVKDGGHGGEGEARRISEVKDH